MPEIADLMDVNLEDLSPEQRQQLQDVMEPAFWEYQGIDYFSGKDWGEGPVEPVSSDQQPIQAVSSYSNF
jgi:hypothetical protein